MAEVKLMVLYLHPTDVAQFDNDYRDHLRLLHQKTNMPEDARPYTVTRFLPTPEGHAPFYQLFTMPFPSAEALQQTMSTPEMQERLQPTLFVSPRAERLFSSSVARRHSCRCRDSARYNSRMQVTNRIPTFSGVVAPLLRFQYSEA